MTAMAHSHRVREPLDIQVIHSNLSYYGAVRARQTAYGCGDQSQLSEGFGPHRSEPAG